MTKWRRFDLEPDSTLRLFGYWRSSASWRVRWALNLKSIPFEYIPINLLKGENNTPEHLRRNPAGAVPVLDLGQGKFLAESVAIIEWIEEVYQLKGPSFFPGTAFERARTRQLVEIINSGTAPLQIPKVQKKVSDDTQAKSDWARYWIHNGLKIFDKCCTETRGLYSVGNQISAADIFLIPQLYNAIRYEINAEKDYPALFEIYNRCLDTDPCKNSSPEKQIDAV